jgi:HPt (histidine-containing phosphotransfer) domain-containing protein
MSEEPVDRARIADLIGDGGADAAQLVGRLVASFLNRAPTLVDQLVAAVAAGDAANAAHWAHVLTGAAGNIGAREVRRIAAAAEHAALAGELDRLETCRADLEGALEIAAAELRTVLTEV